MIVHVKHYHLTSDGAFRRVLICVCHWLQYGHSAAMQTVHAPLWSGQKKTVVTLCKRSGAIARWCLKGPLLTATHLDTSLWFVYWLEMVATLQKEGPNVGIPERTGTGTENKVKHPLLSHVCACRVAVCQH